MRISDWSSDVCSSDLSKGLNVNLPATLAGAGSFALPILNAGYLLDIELLALQTEGRGEVISNPRVVTSNQKEAVITQGREIGYVTVTGGQSNNVPTGQFKIGRASCRERGCQAG